jgi:hypothetical protein
MRTGVLYTKLVVDFLNQEIRDVSARDEPARPVARIDQRAIGVRLWPIGQDHGAHDHPIELAIADDAFLQNIEWYCRLLATELTGLEREYLHKRIAEEHAQLERLKRAGKNSSQKCASKAARANTATCG